MPNDAADNGFQSVLAPFMDQFVQEKHACGYGYHELTRSLHRLDDFLVQEGLATLELPRSVARSWLAKKPHESASTQQQRMTLIRHFSRFYCEPVIRPMFPTPHWLPVICGPSYPGC